MYHQEGKQFLLKVLIVVWEFKIEVEVELTRCV